MDSYVQQILSSLEGYGNERVLFITMGPSGAGKSFLVSELRKKLPKLVVHSLDVCRIHVSKNGKYPSNSEEHDITTRAALPIYKENVMKEKAQYILLDNTHLRWNPDWKLGLEKAKIDNYDIITIMPPLSEYFFITNRSVHLGSTPNATEIFMKMTARWFGYRMKHIINRRLSREILDEIHPMKPDSFGVNKMFILQWGSSGFLYILDGYLGYVDKNMVIACIRSGNYLRENGYSSLFMQKDSLLHMTLIQPKQRIHHDKMKKLCLELIKVSPPITQYDGVNELVDGKNKVIYLSVCSQSQKEWKKRLQAVTKKVLNTTECFFNKDGLHVTLGYQDSDIWNVRKNVEPKWLIKDWDTLSDTYIWSMQVPLTKEVLLEEMKYDYMFQKYLKTTFHESFDKIDIPNVLQMKLGMLSLLPETKFKFKESAWALDENGIHYNSSCQNRNKMTTILLSIQVLHPNRFMSDDECYRNSAKLLKEVPRGLTYMFSKKNGTLRYVNSIFPTPKFFGDNDTEDDVDVMSDSDLQKYSSATTYLITEKANGEMFTFTVCEKLDVFKKWIVVMGSKNNKFSFPISIEKKPISLDSIIQCIKYELDMQGQEYTTENLRNNQWMYDNVWLEMCLTMMETLKRMGTDNMYSLFDFLYQNRYTMCGEFESYLHPHLVSFPYGHQEIKFFALTRHDGMFQCEISDATEILNQLEYMRDKYGINIVKSYYAQEGCDNIIKIKEDIRKKREFEGIVLLVIKNGKVHDRVKLKTMWYVIHRGFREKIKKVLKSMDKNYNFSYSDQFMTTLRDKLAIFNMTMESPEAKEYIDYAGKLSEYIQGEYKPSTSNNLRLLLRFDYPRFIQNVKSLHS